MMAPSPMLRIASVRAGFVVAFAQQTRGGAALAAIASSFVRHRADDVSFAEDLAKCMMCRGVASVAIDRAARDDAQTELGIAVTASAVLDSGDSASTDRLYMIGKRTSCCVHETEDSH
eukprot:TRINITY_DN15198_c0_g1_i2.p1 TRINITY_DN15198_c0_g1~~TRINITY_DN15198_c0_g1_i2.p1  ORF type:complete len:118 (+),score=19.66 TRINITY_DN15198_c0_g1_i2:103-456(+)